MRVTIIFQAFIPGSLGKPLKEYFSKNKLNDSMVLKNYASFNNNLKSVRGKWLREPFSLTNYYKTDDREFGQPGTHRLRTIGTIDLDRIGNYPTNQTVFQHDCDASHQVYARIYDRKYRRPGSALPPEYYGYFNKRLPRTSVPDQNTDTVRNALLGIYITAPGTRLGNDGTIFSTKASAGYPYSEPFSPNIDYSFTLAIHKTPSFCHFDIVGSHNLFPCYELFIDASLIYQYDAVAHGQSGPGLINLNQSTDFSVQHTKMVSSPTNYGRELRSSPTGYGREQRASPSGYGREERNG